MSKNIIFQIDGGIGKCIAATAVCKAIKSQYPNDNLIVISGYPDVFLNNPYVTKSLQFGNISYFHSDYIKDKEVKAMLHNPYKEATYFQRKKHLIETWCDMNEVKYNGEMPEIYLTQREVDFYQKKYQSDKPIFIMQTNGGASADIKYSFARDLPTCVVAPIVEKFSKEYNIVHVRRDDQIGYQGTSQLSAPFRDILACTLLSKKRLFIDSFLQHACKALDMPSVVCWITNSPKNLGYATHTNIMANPFTRTPELRSSYTEEFNISGDPIEFPYNNEEEIFDIEKIISALENQ